MRAILFYGCHHVKRDNLHYTSVTENAVDIVAIATFLISEEVVFYFLPRNLENKERESRRKKVKDTPQISSR